MNRIFDKIVMMVYIFHVFAPLEMEKLETSELQSRLSSLSVSSFPGITSKNCEVNPLNRFVQFFFSELNNGYFRFQNYVNLIHFHFEDFKAQTFPGQ